MENFIEDISSIYWWIAVVIVGIIINIVSSYIRDGIENQLSKFSIYLSNRTDTRIKKNKALIKSLKENETTLMLYVNLDSRFRLRALQEFLFMAFILFYNATYPTASRTVETGSYFFCSFLFMCVFFDLHNAVNVRSNIREAFPDSKLFPN